jgi:hypothetical protein
LLPARRSTRGRDYTPKQPRRDDSFTVVPGFAPPQPSSWNSRPLKRRPGIRAPSTDVLEFASNQPTSWNSRPLNRRPGIRDSECPGSIVKMDPGPPAPLRGAFARDDALRTLTLSTFP